jgi:DNA-binding CsgD family transcriptional regulator
MATTHRDSMTHHLQSLTEKEKQTLRLLLAGHDAKSMARQLGLSVHTVNERLRYARRKLSASSSREAARLLRESEGANPQLLGDKGLGDAGADAVLQHGRQPDAGSSAYRRTVWPIGGLVMISSLAALLALAASPQSAQDRAAPSKASARQAPVAETTVTQAARQWLALVDEAKWQQSFAATTQSFQSLNTVQTWQSASESARVPLGRVLSRSLGSQESVPAPPNGYQLVRFRTDFANKAGAVETLSLAREGESWKVVGYYID